MAVVNNIKEIREQRGIHQNDLAKATGYCTKTIGRIERGESAPSAEFMRKRSNPCTLTFKRPLTTVFLFSDVFWQLW